MCKPHDLKTRPDSTVPQFSTMPQPGGDAAATYSFVACRGIKQRTFWDPVSSSARIARPNFLLNLPWNSNCFSINMLQALKASTIFLQMYEHGCTFET
jgi:hypothetical protein